jgi:hypothetical protein
MARLPKKSVRKLVTLPQELAERVDQFREAIGAASESDALKALIEDGLKMRDRPNDLFLRFEAATKTGRNLGEIINLLASDHPLVESTYLDSEKLIINLKTGSDADERFCYSRLHQTWDWEQRTGNGFGDEDWGSIKPQPPRPTRGRTPVNDLDDDIPF